MQVAVAVSEGKLTPGYPRDIHPRLTALLESVLVLDPLTRPSFARVVEEMEEIVSELKTTVCFLWRMCLGALTSKGAV